MSRAERDAAVELVADLLLALWSEHKATCKDYPCPTAASVEDARRALYSLRKSR